MPKKTKKEKIIADLRRQVKVQTTKTVDYPTESSPEKPQSSYKYSLKNTAEVLKSFESDSSTKDHQNQSLYIYPVHLIKKDLTKTLLLCILAISLEVALFLILEKNLILPFRINF